MESEWTGRPTALHLFTLSTIRSTNEDYHCSTLVHGTIERYPLTNADAPRRGPRRSTFLPRPPRGAAAARAFRVRRLFRDHSKLESFFAAALRPWRTGHQAMRRLANAPAASTRCPRPSCGTMGSFGHPVGDLTKLAKHSQRIF